MTQKKSLVDLFELNDGNAVPCVGFGTWQTPDGDVVVQAVKDALEVGYRHVDTAAAYENEEGVGRALAESGLKREEFFLTTKLWNADRGYESTLAAAKKSLKRLRVDYVDLYLIHWPANDKVYDDPISVNVQTWRAFETLKKDGLVRSIGLSNFLEPHLKQIFDVAEIMPAVDQIECHPGYPQLETVKFCQANNIQVEAWSPLGCGRVLKDERMIALAQKYERSVPQICIRWALQHDVLPLPKSTHREWIESNSKVFDFEISQDDMNLVDSFPEFGFSTFDPFTLPF